MNHGFTVDAATLPANVQQTHVSLFDGTNAGIAWTDKPVFGVASTPKPPPARTTATISSTALPR